jgi:hypothetical protein
VALFLLLALGFDAIRFRDDCFLPVFLLLALVARGREFFADFAVDLALFFFFDAITEVYHPENVAVPIQVPANRMALHSLHYLAEA